MWAGPHAPSPDGTSATSAGGETLTTADGVWSYGAVYGGGKNLLLNGQECRVNNQQPVSRGSARPPFTVTDMSYRKMRQLLPILVFLWTALTVVTATCLQVQRPQYAFNGGQGLIDVPAIDPGPRGGAPAVGGPLTSLTANEISYFNSAKIRFSRGWSVSGTIGGEPGVGLGPRYNVNFGGCAACHAYPTTGGSSPVTNPEVAAATDVGATNTVPSFITVNGPVLIPFLKSSGKLLRLYTIQGRTDAKSIADGGTAATTCVLAQPNWPSLASDVSGHMPIPLWGDGLVDGTPDGNLKASINTAAAAYPGLGIDFGPGNNGRWNFTATGTFAKLGWKGELAALEAFAAFALSVDLGVTTRLFPTETPDNVPGCLYNAQPEDHEYNTRIFNTASAPSDYASDSTNDGAFVRMLASPTPATCSPSPCTVWTSGNVGDISDTSVTHGESVFNAVGCPACHIKQQTTGRWSNAGGGERLLHQQLQLFPIQRLCLALHGFITRRRVDTRCRWALRFQDASSVGCGSKAVLPARRPDKGSFAGDIAALRYRLRGQYRDRQFPGAVDSRRSGPAELSKVTLNKQMSSLVCSLSAHPSTYRQRQRILESRRRRT